MVGTLWIVCGTLAWAMLHRPAEAQVEDRTVPTASYHAAFGLFYDGEYREALKAYTDEARGSIKTPQSRWIDSICYETMIGECYLEMGQLGQALDHYNTAVKLFIAFSDWMLRVQFPPAIQPAAVQKPVPWGASSRRSRLGHYPARMLMGQGRISNNEVFQHGGVVQQAILYPVEVQEIVRCTTLAIRRRARLLGPLCQHDPLTAELAVALSRRPGPPNHWSQAWIEAQYGLAMVAAGKEAQGIAALKQSLVAAGEFDHPMTSIGLLELGRLALANGEYPVAAKYLEEATYAAFNYPDAGVLEEAFRLGALTHLLANRQGVYPPLATAAQWAKVKGLRQLQTSLLMSAAESYAVLGQPRQAGVLLEEARLAIRNRQMLRGRIGARLSFLSSTVLFQQKKIPEGDAALLGAMNYMQQGSYWLFHIGLADGLCVSGALSPRVAMDLYRDVLRDPQPSDWSADPMEALAVLGTPHPLPYEHWFEVALMRKEHETALEIADRARRHRFFCSTPFGGRLLSLRWILEGPPEMLDQQGQLHRQDLRARYPAYDQLSQQARAIRTALGAMPLAPEDADRAKQQSLALGQLTAVSLQQEAILREMAVRREPGGLVFPPLRSTAEIQKSIPPGHALLVFFATSRHLYGFLLNGEKYNYWQIGPPTVFNKPLVALLSELGQYSANHQLALKDLADPRWKQSSAQILELLLRGSRADFSQKFDELVVVPDGVLWYLPFELLQVNANGQQRPLIARVRVRYAPTASLAFLPGRGRNPAGNTAVVVGRLYPSDDPTVAQAAFAQIGQVLPGTVALKAPLPAPSAVYGSLFHRLVVLDDLNLAVPGPYDWAPVPLERNKPGNALGDWLALPWGAPDEVVLPGFHTAAENLLKSAPRAAPGNEIFLSVCGLLASGSRTILLSRWRTGGKSSYDLVREFVQELPRTPPAEAWQRAVFLTAASPLSLEAEPRIKRAAVEDAPRANNPFFWAGYLLVDSGTGGQQPEPAADEPVLKIRKPEPPPGKPERPAEPDQDRPPADPPARKAT